MPEIACGATTPDSAHQPKPQFDAPEQVLDGADAHTATLTTSCGAVSLRLLTAEAPLTANNFAFLASQGFYDGTIVHRIVPGFVVQMGDPKGDGTGGPGYRFADELDAAKRRGYTRGTVAMANAGPDTNGSQFFVCLDKVGLPPAYSVFGEVIDGMDAIDRIASLPVDGEAPQQLCYVESARVDL